MKALQKKLRGAILVQLVLCGPLTGCAGPKATEDAALVEKSERTDDELLYAAVLDVVNEEGLVVDLEDPSKGMVLTQWSEVNRELRHRWVARVVRSNVGLVLTVDSVYERKQRVEGQTVWAAAEDPYTVEEKRRDEQRLGKAIQARFKALKR